jgi:hypothetical protein
MEPEGSSPQSQKDHPPLPILKLIDPVHKRNPSSLSSI